MSKGSTLFGRSKFNATLCRVLDEMSTVRSGRQVDHRESIAIGVRHRRHDLSELMRNQANRMYAGPFYSGRLPWTVQRLVYSPFISREFPISHNIAREMGWVHTDCTMSGIL